MQMRAQAKWLENTRDFPRNYRLKELTFFGRLFSFEEDLGGAGKDFRNFC